MSRVSGPGGRVSGPLRVEQALRRLPDIDALVPLRRFLVSTSQAQVTTEPHRTVGKRFVEASDIREFIPQAVAAASTHLKALYEAVADALEAEQSEDLPGVVYALLRAGKLEETVGRIAQARTWCEHALGVAEGLRDRRPEISTLLQLGQLEAGRGQLEPGARFLQKSYQLADDELDLQDAALACQGLGEVAQAQSRWQGAESWYTRGLRYTEQDPVRAAYLYLGLGDVARSRGELEAAAERLERASDRFESSGKHEGAAHTLNSRGLLEAELGNTEKAITMWREGLAEVHGQTGDRRLEMSLRLNVARVLLDASRFTEAEDEMRRAEERAILLNLNHHLARLYVLMGKLRGNQGDETGFVFFEKALELCQGEMCSPRLEAEVYREYARFRHAFGDSEESLGYLNRARELLELAGDESLLAQVSEELARLPSH